MSPASILSPFRNRFNCVADASSRDLIRGPNGHFSKKTDRRGHERVKARATLLIGALIAPWRGGCIPAAGGRPVGRPGEWIRSARSSYAAHRGPALVGRGIAAIRTAPPMGRAPCSGIDGGSGQGDAGQRERDKNDRSHDGPCYRGLISLIVAPITPRRVGGAPASGARPVTPSRGMDSARKIPPGREPWPSIARTRNSRSSRHPVGSSRTMNRRRRRCWSKTFRPARVTQERSFAWLPPRQSGPCRANIAQADSAVLILCREKGGALSHGDGIVSTRLRRNIGKSSGACGEMVSPAGIEPATY